MAPKGVWLMKVCPPSITDNIQRKCSITSIKMACQIPGVQCLTGCKLMELWPVYSIYPTGLGCQTVAVINENGRLPLLPHKTKSLWCGPWIMAQPPGKDILEALEALVILKSTLPFSPIFYELWSTKSQLNSHSFWLLLFFCTPLGNDLPPTPPHLFQEIGCVLSFSLKFIFHSL